MKIAITGASGKTGYRISEEAVKKGYKVRQIIRKNSKLSSELESLETIRVSLDKKGELDKALKDVDALVIATGARASLDLTGPAKVDAFAGPVKSNDALAPVAIIKASISFKASSSSPFLSNETLIVSKRSSPAETFEFFLMICLTLYPFLTASSEIL